MVISVLSVGAVRKRNRRTVVEVLLCVNSTTSWDHVTVYVWTYVCMCDVEQADMTLVLSDTQTTSALLLQTAARHPVIGTDGLC